MNLGQTLILSDLSGLQDFLFDVAAEGGGHGTPDCGGLWPSAETWLALNQPYLSVYARVTDSFAPHLLRLLTELSVFGFGADCSAGLGQFENVFKRPLLMLRPGACFVTLSPQRSLGRAIPMEELLPQDAANALRPRKRQAIHFAFGLAVPFHAGLSL